MQQHLSVIMATLSEDKNLQQMRFALVPEHIDDQSFWKNYFYRVHLLKQSLAVSLPSRSETVPTALDVNRTPSAAVALSSSSSSSSPPAPLPPQPLLQPQKKPALSQADLTALLADNSDDFISEQQPDDAEEVSIDSSIELEIEQELQKSGVRAQS